MSCHCMKVLLQTDRYARSLFEVYLFLLHLEDFVSFKMVCIDLKS